MNFLLISAATGIGKASVEKLLDQGHTIYASYHVTEPELQHPNLHYFQHDVLLEGNFQEHLPEVLHGMVYFPGSIQLKPFERFKAADFNHDFSLQVIGLVQSIQAALPALKKAEQASIVAFSSVAAQKGMPYHTVVASSKAAIEGLTRSLAAEYAPKIRVNCIAPSLTDTPLATSLLNTEQKREANAKRHPLARVGTSEDIANAVEYLLTDKSSWVTGQVFAVDGGMSKVGV